MTHHNLKFIFAITVLAIGANYVLAQSPEPQWQAPSENPPLGNAFAPLNVGDMDQNKDGGLGLGALFVNPGKVRISDGTEDLNKVFASDENGVGSWKTLEELGFVGGSGGGGGGGALAFGEWESREANNVYRATTDGIVTASSPGSESACFAWGLSDSSSNPTTVRVRDGSFSVLYPLNYPSQGHGITMPVKAGDYWKVQNTLGSLAYCVTSVFWIPMVSTEVPTAYPYRMRTESVYDQNAAWPSCRLVHSDWSTNGVTPWTITQNDSRITHIRTIFEPNIGEPSSIPADRAIDCRSLPE